MTLDERPLRIGIVCPYSFDTPGGVQLHVRDLAEILIARGHHVEVLAPADEDADNPRYVTAAGRAVPVRFNGSVARLNFGPVTAAKVNRWLEKGQFDVLHLHEPITPSIAVLALWAADCPVVATFHTSTLRSRAYQAAYPLIRPSLEKITARIAVSEDARRTVTTHIGGDAVVIPNGVYVDSFATAPTTPAWLGTPQAPTVAFLGRIGEPRKGLQVLAAGWPQVLAAHPGARLLVAGPGDQDAARALFPAAAQRSVTFLGGVSEADKKSLLRSVDVYVAPNTGGESFGIILIEAMSASAAVLASDLPPFVRVLDGGKAGATFRNEDAADLATTLSELLADDAMRGSLAQRGRARAEVFDWGVVATEIEAVYQTVVDSSECVEIHPTSLVGRIRRGMSGTS